MSNFNAPSASTSGTRSLALRLCIWAGIVGPILFVLVFTLDGALTPGYSAIRDAVSYLDLGAYGWIQVANFIVLALLLIPFAVGFFKGMRPVLTSVWRRVSTALLMLSGMGYIIAGLFVPDPSGAPQRSVHGVLHAISFEIVFFSLALACLLIGVRLIRTVGWRGFGWYSLLTGLLTIIPPIGNLIPFFSPAAQTPFSNPSQAVRFGGLFERILLVIAFAWYVILAIRMLTTQEKPANAQALTSQH
jgi:hypothetical membrane protein